MKLYVKQSDGSKKYLNIVASSRESLLEKLGTSQFQIDNEVFDVSQVCAEKTAIFQDTPVVSTVAGAILGLTAGPIGIIGGSLAGAILGFNSDSYEANQVKTFNDSCVR